MAPCSIHEHPSAVVRFLIVLVFVGCNHSSSDDIPISTIPSTPVERCRWACEQALNRKTDRVLAHRGPVDVVALQALFEEENRCRAACGDD